MNERIRELEAQCWEERKYGPAWFDSKKFAELIVRECLAQSDKMRDSLEQDGENEQALGADWAGLAIAKHFGVE